MHPIAFASFSPACSIHDSLRGREKKVCRGDRCSAAEKRATNLANIRHLYRIKQHKADTAASSGSVALARETSRIWRGAGLITSRSAGYLLRTYRSLARANTQLSPMCRTRTDCSHPTVHVRADGEGLWTCVSLLDAPSGSLSRCNLKTVLRTLSYKLNFFYSYIENL